VLLKRCPVNCRNSLVHAGIRVVRGHGVPLHPMLFHGLDGDCDGDLLFIIAPWFDRQLRAARRFDVSQHYLFPDGAFALALEAAPALGLWALHRAEATRPIPAWQWRRLMQALPAYHWRLEILLDLPPAGKRTLVDATRVAMIATTANHAALVEGRRPPDGELRELPRRDNLPLLLRLLAVLRGERGPMEAASNLWRVWARWTEQEWPPLRREELLPRGELRALLDEALRALRDAPVELRTRAPTPARLGVPGVRPRAVPPYSEAARALCLALLQDASYRIARLVVRRRGRADLDLPQRLADLAAQLRAGDFAAAGASLARLDAIPWEETSPLRALVETDVASEHALLVAATMPMGPLPRKDHRVVQDEDCLSHMVSFIPGEIMSYGLSRRAFAQVTERCKEKNNRLLELTAVATARKLFTCLCRSIQRPAPLGPLFLKTSRRRWPGGAIPEIGADEGLVIFPRDLGLSLEAPALLSRVEDATRAPSARRRARSGRRLLDETHVRVHAGLLRAALLRYGDLAWARSEPDVAVAYEAPEPRVAACATCRAPTQHMTQYRRGRRPELREESRCCACWGWRPSAAARDVGHRLVAEFDALELLRTMHATRSDIFVLEHRLSEDFPELRVTARSWGGPGELCEQAVLVELHGEGPALLRAFAALRRGVGAPLEPGRLRCGSAYARALLAKCAHFHSVRVTGDPKTAELIYGVPYAKRSPYGSFPRRVFVRASQLMCTTETPLSPAKASRALRTFSSSSS
jgi:hypothetical protein